MDGINGLGGRLTLDTGILAGAIKRRVLCGGGMIAVVDLLPELPELSDFIRKGGQLHVQIAFGIDACIDAPTLRKIVVHFAQNGVEALDVDARFRNSVIRH